MTDETSKEEKMSDPNRCISCAGANCSEMEKLRGICNFCERKWKEQQAMKDKPMSPETSKQPMDHRIEQAAKEIVEKVRTGIVWGDEGIAAIISRHLSNEWVKCSDRLPEDDKPVLISHVVKGGGVLLRDINGDFVWFARYDGERWKRADGFSDDKLFHGEVTHWMPLPAPPSASTQGESK
jgi:hypothetical protein